MNRNIALINRISTQRRNRFYDGDQTSCTFYIAPIEQTTSKVTDEIEKALLNLEGVLGLNRAEIDTAIKSMLKNK